MIGHILFVMLGLIELFFLTKNSNIKVMMIFYYVMILIQLCHEWYFLPEEQMVDIKKTEEQRSFFFVMALELITMQ